MATRAFTTGRIRQADYDAGTRELQLRFDNGSTLAYRHVPEEVFRRLCSAPNPATYWEDRIAEEYPKGTSRAGSAGDAPGKDLRDLFGGDEEKA